MCNQACIDFGLKYLTPAIVEGKDVVEIGSRIVNFGPRKIVEDMHPKRYTGCDIEAGDGVDEICSASGIVERFGPDSFDLCISTEMLEHVQDWRDAVMNMKRVVRPGGFVLLTTRSKGFGRHGYPDDYWRFEPSTMASAFSDFENVRIEPDTTQPGVFLFAQKPEGWTDRNDMASTRACPVDEPATLEDLGRRYGTDKVGHGYLPHYERHLSGLCKSARNIIEIGVAQGASIHMWRDFFPVAVINGVDVFKERKVYEGGRIKVHIGDQEDKSFMSHVGGVCQPLDIVIDDGGHTMAQQKASLAALFPLVAEGGLYCIEDLHTSYHSEFNAGNHETAIEHLKSIIDDINEHGRRFKDSGIKEGMWEGMNVASIHFYRSLCVIEKGGHR